MAITTSNVETSTDSFQNWIDKTNVLLDAYSTSIVTTSANTVGGLTTGNATVNGIFTAKSLTVDGNSSFGMRGGTVDTANVLYITSNVSIGNSTVNTVINTTEINTDLGLSVLGTTTLRVTNILNDLSVSGNISMSGALSTLSGNLSVDSGVLYVDATNNKIGINNTTPVSVLSVSGNATIDGTFRSTGIITANAGVTSIGNMEVTGYVNASAGFTVSGTRTFVANSSLLSFGNTTTNVVVNSTGAFISGGIVLSPLSNTSGTGLGTSTQRWNIVANTATFSGNATFSAAVVANGSAGIDTQVLTSNGSGVYWADSGVEITDESTNATRYVTFSPSTSGQATVLNIDSSNFTYNPSTGVVSAVEFSATSDASAKENISTLTDALSKVSQLRGVSYRFKNTGVENIGLIAQEVESIIPEVVRSDDNGLKSVTYGNIVGLLVEAIKELKQEIDQLKNGN
jgi:Chaperone of endosialidase